jgi:hypothetical protein
VNYHLICVHPFAKYIKGQRITDPALVAQLLEKRAHHFVKIAVPASATKPAPHAG